LDTQTGKTIVMQSRQLSAQPVKSSLSNYATRRWWVFSPRM